MTHGPAASSTVIRARRLKLLNWKSRGSRLVLRNSGSETPLFAFLASTNRTAQRVKVGTLPARPLLKPLLSSVSWAIVPRWCAGRRRTRRSPPDPKGTLDVW